MKWATLTVAVAFIFWVQRRFKITIERSDMSEQWLSDWQRHRLGETREWTGAGYEGKFKR